MGTSGVKTSDLLRRSASKILKMDESLLVPCSEQACGTKETSKYDLGISPIAAGEDIIHCWQDHLKVHLRKTGLSVEAVEILMRPIRPSTEKQYTTYVTRFLIYCSNASISFSNVKETDVIIFLQFCYNAGSGYRTITTASSAVGHLLTLLGFPIKSTAMLTKYKRGVFNSMSALPKYVNT